MIASWKKVIGTVGIVQKFCRAINSLEFREYEQMNQVEGSGSSNLALTKNV